jgi:hypothetical protein
MTSRQAPNLKEWFGNCGGWWPRHDLNELRRGVEAGLLNAQDPYSMTGHSLVVMSSWREGVDELLRAGADTELRSFQNGVTPLLLARQHAGEPIIAALVAAGANPDAPNYWGLRRSMREFTVPDEWVTRLAEAIAAAVQDFAPVLGDEPVALFAVDCHPWHGRLGLAVLTSAELAGDSTLADPAEMAEWEHYDFTCDQETGKPFEPLGQEMRSAYEQAEDKAGAAEAFLRACAAAVTSDQVTAALALMKRDVGFRVSVAHPDSDQEFVGAD